MLQISGWPGIRAAAKDDPALNERLKSVDDKHDVLVLQVIEPRAGKYLGSVLIDTGKSSFDVSSSRVLGDTVFVGDSLNRTLLYSLGAGAQKGKLPGTLLAATSSGKRALMTIGPGVVDLFDTGTLQLLRHYTFPGRVIHADFLPDGSLSVLTADQTVYQINPDAVPQNASVQ